MAVYTTLEADALSAWLATHDVGGAIDCRGIASGIENSNFFVTTVARGVEQRFVLTLFERLDEDALSYYLALMRHLAARGVPCPAPIADRAGRLHAPLAGKPAALVTRLAGQAALQPNAQHCAAIGAALARLHLAGRDFASRVPNPRGHAWWIAAAGRVRVHLDASQRDLLDDEIATMANAWPSTTQALPHGPIHADLFRDNALFEEAHDGFGRDGADGCTDVPPRLGGIIDFYFAGTDAWLLDLAISLNDWCVDLDSGVLDDLRLHAMIDAYDRERPLMTAERVALPLALRAAALRFWLSRLDDLHQPRPAQLLTPHDPTRFERMLRLRRDADRVQRRVA